MVVLITKLVLCLESLLMPELKSGNVFIKSDKIP